MNLRRLTLVACIGAIIYVCMVFFNDSVEYPLPDYSKSDVFNQIEHATKQLDIPSMNEKEIQYFDAVANSSIGRYVEANHLNEQELKELSEEVPLYIIEIENLKQTYQINPQNGQLTKATNISIFTEDIDQFIKTNFGEGYELISEDSKDGTLTEWDVKWTYQAKTKFNNVVKIVDIYTIDNYIIQFDHYGFATKYSFQSESAGQYVLYFGIFVFLITLVVIVTIQLIKRLIKKQIEGFIGPLILTIAAGFGWVFVTKAMNGTVTGIAMLDPVLMTYLTFAVLLIRWKKVNRNIGERVRALQPHIKQGFFTAIIGITLGELYFFFAGFFDVWVSPVLNHSLLILNSPWVLPVFTLFVGLSAAVTEEAIFRNYMGPFFERFGVVTAVIATSLLWGILHIGYDMYPWYLYVIEFILFTGPLFYFVFKNYGFSTVIFLHFFYNAWVSTLFLFSIDMKLGLLSLVVMFSPFCLFFYRRPFHIKS